VLSWCLIPSRLTNLDARRRSPLAPSQLGLTPAPNLPPEIWGIISSFACTDDGLTGQSLALVSSSVNHGTYQNRLQSASVHGATEMQRFLEVLELRPADHRIVRNLYIGEASRSEMAMASKKAKVSPSNHWHKTYQGIIENIAPYIEALTVADPAPRFPLGMRLPLLQDLSVFNYVYTGPKFQNESPPETPRLLRLHLWGSLTNGQALSLVQYAPQLRCLRLTGARQITQLGHTLGNLLDAPVNGADEFESERNAAAVHPTLRLVTAEPLVAPRGKCGTGRAMNSRMIHCLRDLAAATCDRSRRMVLLPTASREDMYSSRQAYEDWIEVVSGGRSPQRQPEGPWIGYCPE
jgi:hypothetical protein